MYKAFFAGLDLKRPDFLGFWIDLQLTYSKHLWQLLLLKVMFWPFRYRLGSCESFLLILVHTPCCSSLAFMPGQWASRLPWMCLFFSKCDTWICFTLSSGLKPAFVFLLNTIMFYMHNSLFTGFRQLNSYGCYSFQAYSSEVSLCPILLWLPEVSRHSLESISCRPFCLLHHQVTCIVVHLINHDFPSQNLILTL